MGKEDGVRDVELPHTRSPRHISILLNPLNHPLQILQLPFIQLLDLALHLRDNPIPQEGVGRLRLNSREDIVLDVRGLVGDGRTDLLGLSKGEIGVGVEEADEGGGHLTASKARARSGGLEGGGGNCGGRKDALLWVSNDRVGVEVEREAGEIPHPHLHPHHVEVRDLVIEVTHDNGVGVEVSVEGDVDRSRSRVDGGVDGSNLATPRPLGRPRVVSNAILSVAFLLLLVIIMGPPLVDVVFSIPHLGFDVHETFQVTLVNTNVCTTAVLTHIHPVRYLMGKVVHGELVPEGSVVRRWARDMEAVMISLCHKE